MFEPGFELLIVPINYNANHWLVACVDFVKRRIEIHDSIAGSCNPAIIHKVSSFASFR